MSTRGMIGFIADGTKLGTYNHSDSYPDWLGTNVLAWLRSLVAEGEIEQAKAKVLSLKVISDSEATPTPEDVEQLKRWANFTVGGPGLSWYQLLRETQGHPAAILDSGHIIDGWEYGHDDVFCEWVYLVDFDAGQLIVQHDLTEREPIVTFDFGDLPDDETFIRLINEA